ncbi:hypothetical protein ACF0H5_000591 [Mactra antiquata]
MERIRVAKSTNLLKFELLKLNAQDNMTNTALWNVFSYSNLVHAVSGAVGSVVGLTVFFPLDTARTRLQVDDDRKAKSTPYVLLDITNQEGFSALYRGLIPVVTTLCCSNFVYFYAYNSLKAVVAGKGYALTAVMDLSLAFISGVINVLLTTPLWVANTRLKLQGATLETRKYTGDKHIRYKGLIDCLLKIVKYEGLSALWDGTKPSIILASNPAIQFMVYDKIKEFFQWRLNTNELSGFLYFIIGALAKSIATVITYPLQIIQSRLRAGFDKESQPSTMYASFQNIIRQSGVLGLYKGMEAKLLQTVLTAALMFVVYEKIAAVTFRLFGLEYSKLTR